MDSITLKPRKGYAKRIQEFIILVIALSIIVNVGIYCLSPCTDSDMVEGLFWAEAAIDSGHLMNPEFVYPYAIPFGANFIFIPFVSLFGLTQLANQLGMLFFYLIMVIITFLFMKTIEANSIKALVGTAIIMLAFRSQMGVNLLHHILFYQLGFIFFMGLTTGALHILENPNKSVRKKWVLFLFVFSVWSGANGISTIMLAVFPVLFALAAMKLTEKTSGRKLWNVMQIIVFGVILGYALFILLTQNIKTSSYLEDAGTYNFSSISNWIAHIQEIPRLWIEIFLINDPAGTSILSVKGIEITISILISIITGFIPFYFLIRFKRNTFKVCFILYGCIVVWIVCLAQFIFIRFSSNERLLYNGLCVNFFLLVIFIYELWPKFSRHKMLSFTAFGIIGIYSLLFPLNANWSYRSLNFDELLNRGLTYGVAFDYNLSNINTISSGGQVKIRQVQTENYGLIYPRAYQSQYSWYQKPTNCKKWFLLLKDEEYEKLISSANIMLLDSCDEILSLQGDYSIPWDNDRNAYNEVLENQGFKALVFSTDLWREIVLGQKFIYNTSSKEYTNNCDYIDNYLLIHEGGMSFGPYMRIAKGQICNVSIEGKHLLHATVEAYSYQSGKKLDLQMEELVHEDEQIRFKIVAPINLDGLEVNIKNIVDDYQEDVILDSKVLKIELPDNT